MWTPGGHMTTTGIPITGTAGNPILITRIIIPGIITIGPTIIHPTTGTIIITDIIHITVAEGALAAVTIQV